MIAVDTSATVMRGTSNFLFFTKVTSTLEGPGEAHTPPFGCLLQRCDARTASESSARAPRDMSPTTAMQCAFAQRSPTAGRWSGRTRSSVGDRDRDGIVLPGFHGRHHSRWLTRIPTSGSMAR
jgi:hypothetical protein